MRTTETKSAYFYRAKKLMSAYKKKTGHSWQENPVAVANWLASRKPELSKSTFRQYKAALRFFMEKHGPKEAIEALDGLSQTGCPRGSQTSSKKAKKISADDLATIMDALSTSKSKYAPLVALWLYCGLLTGLRPCEWGRTTLMNNDNRLIVKNAKATNGRGNGSQRTLLLDQLHPKDRQTIAAFLALISKMSADAGGFATLQSHSRAWFGRLTRRLWPQRAKRPSLYSCRHQCMADLKQSGLTRAQIAAIAGHAVDETATLHYARKVTGSRRSVHIRCPTQEVNTVKKTKLYRYNPKKMEKKNRV